MSSSTDGESLSLQQRQILDTIDKKQRGICMLDPLYQCQGFWIPPEPSLIGILFMQDHFSTDVVLATNPECGITWLKALIFAIMKRRASYLNMISSEKIDDWKNYLTTEMAAVLDQTT
uniref:Sulfotransferase n=1 Tax=Populus trichocarpa TaxID=3694 RepID=A0A2K2ACG6_POPTR